MNDVFRVSLQSHAYNKYRRIFQRKAGKSFTWEDSDDELEEMTETDEATAA